MIHEPLEYPPASSALLAPARMIASDRIAEQQEVFCIFGISNAIVNCMHWFLSLKLCLNLWKLSLLRERPFFNPGYRGGGFFSRGTRLSSITLWGYENLKSKFYGVQNYFA